MMSCNKSYAVTIFYVQDNGHFSKHFEQKLESYETQSKITTKIIVEQIDDENLFIFRLTYWQFIAPITQGLVQKVFCFDLR